jgi:hypothetical protein
VAGSTKVVSGWIRREPRPSIGVRRRPRDGVL